LKLITLKTELRLVSTE